MDLKNYDCTRIILLLLLQSRRVRDFADFAFVIPEYAERPQ